MSGVLGLIPARAGSKGVPRKNLRLLGGTPLIVHTLRSAAASTRLTRIIVSTDSDEIRQIAQSHGADAPFVRPVEFGQDDSPMIDVVRHALGWLREHEGYVPACVVLLQPTVPFRAPDLIDQAIDLLQPPDIDAVISVAPVPAAHNMAWQLRLREGVVERGNGAPLSTLPTRRQDLEPAYFRDGAVYAFKTAAFWRTSTFYGERTAAIVNPTAPVNIDSPEDWARAEAEAERLKCEGNG